METTAIFVLGALSGLVIMALIYTFIGVLNATKQIKTHESDINGLRDSMYSMQDDIWRRFNDTEQDISQRMDRMDENMNRVTNELSTSITRDVQELYSYIDSRIDKAISTSKNK